MTNVRNRIVFITIVILLLGEVSIAQSRSTINSGVDKYEK